MLLQVVVVLSRPEQRHIIRVMQAPYDKEPPHECTFPIIHKLIKLFMDTRKHLLACFYFKKNPLAIKLYSMIIYTKALHYLTIVIVAYH